jgi:predicted HTH transcriptional regulator
MESGQSDIRNKTLAPVFKKLGIIEQWGNGLQLIAEDLKQYPEIDFRWSQPGLGFRVALINTNDVQQREPKQEIDKKQPVSDDYGRLRAITDDYGRLSVEQKKILLFLMNHEKITRKTATTLLGLQKSKTYDILVEMVKADLISIFGKGRGTYYSLKKHP